MFLPQKSPTKHLPDEHQFSTFPVIGKAKCESSMERQKSIVYSSNMELKSKICSIRSGQNKEQIFNSSSTYNGMNLPTLATARPSMACAAKRFVLKPLATCVSAADKKLAHPNLIQTIVCDTIHEDKIKYFPPSSYPEEGKIEGMTQERTMLTADFDVASCKHVERTNNILNVVELVDVFTKKYFQHPYLGMGSNQSYTPQFSSF